MSVLALASAVAGFVKIRYIVEKALIDNLIFRLHYRVTTAILFLCCILVTANNLIGDPISCITDGGVPAHVINTFCWITYTFTLPGVVGDPGTHVAHPGVASAGPDEEKKYHAYYQWVPFMLFFQLPINKKFSFWKKNYGILILPFPPPIKSVAHQFGLTTNTEGSDFYVLKNAKYVTYIYVLIFIKYVENITRKYEFGEMRLFP
ncbi:unnamed protein product [Nesidiocoris tenuis]|uniref:Innexin n=1 Tax=Nesidiocoris tenuis TaxID=355587 RepID=A0A6H5H4F8_9HEMI|nr:unnamed protein product [Nesidiocoris tenuis]